MKNIKYSRLFIIVLIGFAGLSINQLSAQALTTITIKAGEGLAAVYKQMYRFPQFTYGKVYFMNRDSAKGRLNYNMLIGKMQFINQSGDTLTLSDDNPVRLVAIDTSLFYCNNKECAELVAGYPPAEFAVVYRLKLADEQKIGAFGLPTSTQTIENKESFTDKNYPLLLNKDLVFTKETQYYFIDGDNHFTIANKRNLLKLFPKQNSLIENYLQKNAVDFKNDSDLRNLFVYVAKAH